MLRIKNIIYLLLFFSVGCNSPKESQPPFIWTEPSSLEKILQKGTLDISTFYNTTDYYIYKGITRGFHYELAQDFANYLGVKLQIIEVNNNLDSAIQRLQNRRYDLLALSLTQTSSRQKLLHFSHPLFYTREVLVQNSSQPLITTLKEHNNRKYMHTRQK